MKVIYIPIILMFFALSAIALSAEVYAENEPEINEAVSSVENQEDDRPLAIVRRYRPTVNIASASFDELIEAERAQELNDSDTLVTAEDGYAMVQFMDNSVARVQPNSVLIVSGEFTEENTTAARLALQLGEVFLNVQDDRSDYEVSTSSAVAAVRGTEFIVTSDQDGSTRFVGMSGEVEIFAINSEEVATLLQNNMATVDSEGNEIDLTELTDEEIAEIRRLYEEWDSRTETETFRIQFENEEGEVRDIELQYFDNIEN